MIGYAHAIANRPVFIERTSRNERIVQGSVGAARVERDGPAIRHGIPPGSFFPGRPELACVAERRYAGACHDGDPGNFAGCIRSIILAQLDPGSVKSASLMVADASIFIGHDAPMSFILPETEPDQGASATVSGASLRKNNRVPGSQRSLAA